MTTGRRILGRGPRIYFRLPLLLLTSLLTSAPVALAQYPSGHQITKDGTAVMLEDYASLPLSTLRKEGVYPPKIDFAEQLGRVNAVRSEPTDVPSSATRFFVPDDNGVLYILDKNTKKFTSYIDFGRIFPKFTTDPGYGSGLVSIALDPAYSKNGKFYTVHTEKLSISGSAAPTNTAMPSLDLAGFNITAAIDPPAGEVGFQSILVEWTDTNIENSTFEGTAREIMREGYNFALHPMGDLLFNPLARPGQADYGNLYISVGDGTSGERPGVTHTIPQRLDALPGKILRITPDITLRPADELSSNGRYRIPSTGPNANPFVSVSGARGEIYAYGLRNPHRMNWDPITNNFIVNTIGNHSWESVVIVAKGANYGWAEREGSEQEFIGGPNNGKTGSQIDPPVPFPSPDTVVVDRLMEPVTPLYPVATYSHRDGDAIGSGFVYRGKLLPQLVGKYVFTDITTGRLFYSDLAEMLAAGGIRNKVAEIHEIQIIYKSPYETSEKAAVKRRMYDIVADAFAHKEGVGLQNTVLPGAAASVGGFRGGILGEKKFDTYGVAYGGGRADVRLSVDGDGELYVLSKSDGMIRKIVSVVTPPPPSKMGAAR
jgi:Glucose / Sorbosone dehydrogenase